MAKPKPLDAQTCLQAADILRALADELTADHAPRTQELISIEAYIGYPKRASGTQGNPGNQTDEHGHPTQPDTPTEAAALNPDQTALHAHNMLITQRETIWAAAKLLRQLQARSPKRIVKVCPRCHHPITAGRCQQRDEDGRLCGSTPEDWPLCKGCAESIPPGKRRLGYCPSCRGDIETKGYTKAGMTKYRHMVADMITDEGVHHS